MRLPLPVGGHRGVAARQGRFPATATATPRTPPLSTTTTLAPPSGALAAGQQPWSHEGYHKVPRPMRPGRAARPLKILFLYSRPPLPMTRGDELTVSHLIEFMHARGHVVDLLTLVAPGHAFRDEHRAWLESRCRRVETVALGRAEGLAEAGRGLARGWPFQIGYLLSRRQLARAAELARGEGYDLAYAYYIRSTEALLAAAPHVPVTFLALQLSQTLNTERLARTAARGWERAFYRFEHARMAAYESRIWQGVSRVVLIGEKDRAAIEAACRRHGRPVIDNVVWGPHGVDTERFAPRGEGAEEPGAVLMSGVMRYAPNVEAALWFACEVWPLVRRERGDARFYLVGRDPDPAVQALDGKDGVVVTGTVEEPADWIARAQVCVAPIRAAAGLQNKLLEALAMGKAVVATPEANEGIAAGEGRDLVLAREPEAFARAVVGLLGDAGRRRELGAAGRRFVEAKWTWEGPFLELEAAFYEALEAQDATQRPSPQPSPARAGEGA
jgi:polysaccharide biosynthesis protein PslH